MQRGCGSELFFVNAIGRVLRLGVESECQRIAGKSKHSIDCAVQLRQVMLPNKKMRKKCGLVAHSCTLCLTFTAKSTETDSRPLLFTKSVRSLNVSNNNHACSQIEAPIVRSKLASNGQLQKASATSRLKGTDTADKSSRHAPSCRPLVSIYCDSRWTAHGMCLLL